MKSFSKVIFAVLAAAAGIRGAYASVESDKQKVAPFAEKQNIKQMAGCYEVQFQFTETFALKDGYQLKEPYKESALEWVTVDQETDTTVELQHILIIGKHLQKHWRQNWTYEPADQWDFKGDGLWIKNPLSATHGAWRQDVLQVDDGPRYSCTAPWIESAGKSFWECEAWSPLPRREFSKRSDYNVLNRRNRHEIFPWGWNHEQDNVKLKAQNGKAVENLVEEKGKDVYTKTDPARCENAKQWWRENKVTWDAIREAWGLYYTGLNRLEFAPQKGPTWMGLFELAEKAQKEGWDPGATRTEAMLLIDDHLK